MNRLVPLLILSCLAVTALAANQKVYEWTDATGIKHYSDSPPPQGTPDVHVVNVHASTPPTEQAAPATQDTAAPAGKGAGNAASAPKAPPMTPEERDSACQTARHNLELLQSNPPQGLHTTGDDGKTKQITAADLQNQIAKADQQIRFFCKQ